MILSTECGDADLDEVICGPKPASLVRAAQEEEEEKAQQD